MKKLIAIFLIALGLVVALMVAVGTIAFVLFERGEKTLSAPQVEERLVEAGFKVLPQRKLKLYAEQEALFPEKPGKIQTIRLNHSDGGSTLVTAASFSNEKISHSLEGKTNGFPSRNWFFFGVSNSVKTKQVQDALKAGEDEMVYRLKVNEIESEPLASSSQAANGAPPENKRPEEVLSRGEIIERFLEAGLKINRIEEDKEMPASIKKKLTAEPRDDFLLFIEDEGIFPIEFESVKDAIQMQQNHEKGFRCGNWYFPGQITAELRKKLEAALLRSW